MKILTKLKIKRFNEEKFYKLLYDYLEKPIVRAILDDDEEIAMLYSELVDDMLIGGCYRIDDIINKIKFAMRYMIVKNKKVTDMGHLAKLSKILNNDVDNSHMLRKHLRYKWSERRR